MLVEFLVLMHYPCFKGMKLNISEMCSAFKCREAQCAGIVPLF